MMLNTTFARRAATTAFSSRAFSTTQRAQLARMQVIGRLAAEPEVVNTSTGKEMVRYSLASNHGPRDNQQTSWFRVASFAEGPQRDFLLSVPKGALVFLEADARVTQYEDDQGGKRSGLSLIQRNIEVLSRPKAKEDGAEPAAASA